MEERNVGSELEEMNVGSDMEERMLVATWKRGCW